MDRWTDAVHNDVRKVRIVNWTQVVQGRVGWRGASGEGLVLLGSGETRRRRR